MRIWFLAVTFLFVVLAGVVGGKLLTSLKTEQGRQLVKDSRIARIVAKGTKVQDGGIEDGFRLLKRYRDSHLVSKGKANNINANNSNFDESLQNGPSVSTVVGKASGAVLDVLDVKNTRTAKSAPENSGADWGRVVAQIRKLEAENAKLKASYDATIGLRSENDALKKQAEQYAQTKQLFEAQQKELEELSLQIRSKDEELHKVATLEHELINLRNELLLKETELVALRGGRRPAGVQQAASRAGYNTYGQPPVAASQPAYNGNPRGDSSFGGSSFVGLLNNRIPMGVSDGGVAMHHDVMVAQVSIEKANLRSGPGMEHSPVMTVSRGTRLTVEERVGDWLRVVTPTDGRAFVRTDMVEILASDGSVIAPRSPDMNSVAESIASIAKMSVPESKAEKPKEPDPDELFKEAFNNIKGELNKAPQ